MLHVKYTLIITVLKGRLSCQRLKRAQHGGTSRTLFQVEQGRDFRAMFRLDHSSYQTKRSALLLTGSASRSTKGCTAWLEASGRDGWALSPHLPGPPTLGGSGWVSWTLRGFAGLCEAFVLLVGNFNEKQIFAKMTSDDASSLGGTSFRNWPHSGGN